MSSNSTGGADDDHRYWSKQRGALVTPLVIALALIGFLLTQFAPETAVIFGGVGFLCTIVAAIGAMARNGQKQWTGERVSLRKKLSPVEKNVAAAGVSMAGSVFVALIIKICTA